jgi:sulfur-carrier protein adenylyltransferase/sulfurtransferase
LLEQNEILRYARQIQLDGFGMEGQEKLKKAKILVIGAGGLGCPALLYLCAAGLGTIGIVEFDVVSETNLHRQILYTSADVGKPKIVCAIEKLKAQNPFVTLIAHAQQLTTKNAFEIVKNYDLVIDGTDNFATRYMVNDICVLLDKPLIYGSISRFEGQVSVFNALLSDGKRGPNYRNLFPEPPSPETAPNCSEVGVLGVLPGIIGSMQANEAIKLITGIGEILSGKLFILNILTMNSYTISYTKTEENGAPENLDEFEDFDYSYFCNTSPTPSVLEITSKELREWLKSDSQDIEILDIRDENEQPNLKELAGLRFPINTLINNIDKLNTSKKIVVICTSGNRSKLAVSLLAKHGINNAYSLHGGIEAWLTEREL